jgi:nickel-dependent lactate racemase
MKIELDYGRSKIEVKISRKNILNIIDNKAVKPLLNPRENLKNSLMYPIKSLPLKEKCKNKKNICIVISDNTRPMPAELIIEEILNESFNDENLTEILDDGEWIFI